MLALVGEAKAISKTRKATVDYNELKYNIDEYLRTNGDEHWRELFIPLITGVVADQSQEWASVLGMEFDVRNLAAETWFQQYTLQFAQPITQTSSDGVHSVIEQGLAEGWAIPTMQGHIEQLFTQWMNGGATAEEFAWYSQRLPPHRTEMIARTETLHSSNAGSYNQMDAWGVGFKGWLASIDGRERDTHRVATMTYDEGGSVGVIPMSQPFVVGGYSMMYPLDGSMGAAIGEIVNCRCTILPYPEKPAAKPGEGVATTQDYTGPADERKYDPVIGEKYAQSGQEWLDGLSSEEKVACLQWCGVDYQDISSRVRTDQNNERSQNFIDAVRKAPVVTDITYIGERGRRILATLGTDLANIDWDSAREAAKHTAEIKSFWDSMIGMEYVIPGAKSGSLSANVAREFAYDGGYVFQIKSNRGRWINPSNRRSGNFNDEFEVHFLEQTSLRILETREVEIWHGTRAQKTLLIICEDITEE